MTPQSHPSPSTSTVELQAIETIAAILVDQAEEAIAAPEDLQHTT